MSAPSRPPDADGVGAPPEQTKGRRGGSAALRRYATALGAAAAIVVAVLLNVLAARHYRRWDWTEAGLYTLSGLTRQTLSALDTEVQVFVLLGSDDPVALTLRQLLQSYQSHTARLQVRFIDPDRNPAELLAIQQKYGIVAGRSEDGQLTTDAALVVARGPRHHFITAPELFAVEREHAIRARPRLEEALTGAIRRVSAGRAPEVCFTTAHGEPSLEEGGAEGLMAVGSRLGKLNFEATALPPLAKLTGDDPIGGCRVVVVAAPQRPFEDAELERLEQHFRGGGGLLVMAGPVPDARERGYVELRLGRLLRLAGVRQRRDVVFERDPARRSAAGFGETLIATPLEHPITAGLLQAGDAAGVVLAVSSSLQPLPDSAVAPSPLLTTSDEAFGMAGFFAWADNPSEPEPRDEDAHGPLTLAFAAELPRRGGEQPHGPRMVVIASASPAYGANWQKEQLGGSALFVESAISWLASAPLVLDIPAKPARPVGLRISAQVLAAAAREVILYLPLGVALLGLAIGLGRRRSEGRSRGRAARAGDDA